MNNKQKKSKSKPRDPFMFYHENDFNYEVSLVQNYYKTDSSFKVILYRVDIVKSKVHSLYGEAKAQDKKILDPVELTAVLNIGDVSTTNQSEIGISRETFESFSFSVFLSELSEKDVEIRRGDFILYNDGNSSNFFEITKTTNIQTKNTMYGFKPFYFGVQCTLVKDDALPKELKSE